nr:hypothetical protein [uncultured Methanoregula sp.]
MDDRFTTSRGGMIPVAALVFLVLIGLCLPVSALNISVSQYKGSVAPGGTVNYAVLAGNSWTDEPVDLLVDVMGIYQKPDLQYTAVDPIKDTYTYSARKYTSVEQNAIHVDKGEKKQIILSFQLPADAGDGGRYAMVVIHTLPGKNVTASETNIPVFLTILGSEPTVTGSITSVDVSNGAAGQPATVTTTYKNTGNIHQENVVNTVTISGSEGNLLVTNSTALQGAAILPDKSFAFTVQPDTRNLPAGTYTVLSKVLVDKVQADKKTTTITIATGANSTSSGITTHSEKTPAPVSPAATKSPLPPVLCLAALAGTFALIAYRQKQN